MSRNRFARLGAGVLFGLSVVASNSSNAQSTKTEAKGPLPVASAGDQVIVKKDAIRVLDSRKYRVPLSIDPIQTVMLTAPFDGIVKQTTGKSNSKVQSQSEIVRLDTTVTKLNLARAEAALKVALSEQKIAGDKDETHKTLSQAKVDVAKAEVDLAKFHLESCSIRAPFAGELQRLLVTDGQFVKQGDPVAVVVDVAKMKVEIPVERSSAEQGKGFPLKIESTEVEGKIDAVLPLSPRFGELRELFNSVASALVVVDNPDNNIKAGQTVYVPLIPQQSVTDVPTSAIANGADGNRKVQIVRNGTVRDISVVLMGSIGNGRVYVSGAFAEGDEVIYESSHQFNDGFVLKPSTAPATAAAGSANPATPASSGNRDTAPAKAKVGF